jgi:hypothetical protein
MSQSGVQQVAAQPSHPVLPAQRNVFLQTGEQIRPYKKGRLYGYVTIPNANAALNLSSSLMAFVIDEAIEL